MYFSIFTNSVNTKELLKYLWGISILIKDELYNTFKIKIIDKCVEGILGVQFIHNDIGSTFIVYVCYLAPHNLPYGRNQTNSFGHLISQMYFHSENEQIYICGDFNSRIGHLNDTIDSVDLLPMIKKLWPW